MPLAREAAFWGRCSECVLLEVGDVLIRIDSCSFHSSFPVAPSITSFHSSSAFPDGFSGVTSTKKPCLERLTQEGGWKTQGLETITGPCTMSKVDHNSSCFFFIGRSLKCPHLSNQVSFRYFQPFSWKVIAHLMNFLSFIHNPSQTPPPLYFQVNTLHACTTFSANISLVHTLYYIKITCVPAVSPTELWGSWGCNSILLYSLW